MDPLSACRCGSTHEVSAFVLRIQRPYSVRASATLASATFVSGMVSESLTSFCCSRLWIAYEPVAGEADAARPINCSVVLFGAIARRRGSTNVQPPMFCGSSCVQTVSVAFGYDAKIFFNASAGNG